MQKPAGTSIAPIFLRIVVGVTFMWAGLGKLEGEMRVSGEPAALLANMGLHVAKKNAQAVTPAAEVPVAPPPVVTDGESGAPTGVVGPPTPQPEGVVENPGASKEGVAPAPQPVMPDGQHAEAVKTAREVAVPPLDSKVPRVYDAAEFPKEFAVKRVYGLALMLHRAASPAPRADGTVPTKLWPQRFGRGSWPLFFAWSVAITEVVGGVCVLAGLLTRASAAGLACVMIGAMWLTEVGPAVQAGTTVLGFIPDRDWLAVDQWKTLFWQFSLVMSALALACMGSGAMGFDRKLFPPIPPAPTNVKPMM